VFFSQQISALLPHCTIWTVMNWVQMPGKLMQTNLLLMILTAMKTYCEWKNGVAIIYSKNYLVVSDNWQYTPVLYFLLQETGKFEDKASYSSQQHCPVYCCTLQMPTCTTVLPKLNSGVWHTSGISVQTFLKKSASGIWITLYFKLVLTTNLYSRCLYNIMLLRIITLAMQLMTAGTFTHFNVQLLNFNFCPLNWVRKILLTYSTVLQNTYKM
jgi:hypothetical protein